MSDFAPSKYVRPLPVRLPRPEDQSLEFEVSNSEQEVQLREYFRIFLKYRMLIAAAVGVGFVFALMYAFTATPLYTASATLRISTYEPVLTSTKIEDMLQERSRESTYLETQVQELKSFSLADKVLEDQGLRAQLERGKERGFWSVLFGGGKDMAEAPDEPQSLGVDYTGAPIGYQSPLRLIRGYLGMVEIKPVRRTSLVNVAVTAEEPMLAALLANRHANSYIEWVRTTRVEQQARGLTFLRAQSEELREKVVGLERELADYAESNSIVAVNKDENITAQRMSQLNRLLTDASAKRIEFEKLHAEAQASLKSPAAGFDDASTQSMRAELAKLEGELQQLLAKYTEQYPRVQQVRSQIQGLKASIEGARSQVVRGLKAKMLAAQEEEKSLKEELEQQKSQAFELAKRQVQYNVLNRELASSREMLESVLRQIKETSLAVESNASNVSVVDLAVPPQAPSYPRKWLLVLIGVGLGLASGVGLAFLLNYLDNTVRTPEDLTQTLRIPSLGVVPSFELEMLGAGGETGGGATGASPSGPSSSSSEGAGRAGRAAWASSAEEHEVRGASEESSGLARNGSDTSGYGTSAPMLAGSAGREGGIVHARIAFLSDPRSLAAEAYRTIRTGILLSQAGEPPRTLLVTSAQSSEGKTTSSINLAASLASAGGRVALVDADLRRPSVHKHFGLDANAPGLVEVITGTASLAEVLLPDVIKRVHFVRSGKIPPNPAELLGSLEMASVIDQLAQHFDYVIIDSPPILPVTDSVILSRYVDGVVLVIRGAATPRKVIKDARDRLRAVGARLLGAILNDVDVTAGDYYYYNRYYQAYYRSEEESNGDTGSAFSLSARRSHFRSPDRGEQVTERVSGD
jgi:capsular exopolysaccharide synthesis family protein